MEYKMVVLDMDGTLLNDAKEITSLNRDVLFYLYQQGIQIVIATGRRFWYAQPPLLNLGFPVQVLASNGSVIRHSLTGEKSFQSYMSSELYRSIIRLGREYGFSPLIHVDHYEDEWDYLIDRDFTDPLYASYVRPKETRYRIYPDLLEYEGERAMVLCFMGDYEKMIWLEQLINKHFPDQCNTHVITSVTQVGPILEVMSHTCGKWRSLKGYAALKDIGVEEIITIGDDINDLEMICEAGLGIAMLNAVAEVKDKAKQITPTTNNEDGVALVLKDIYKLD